MKVYIVNKVDDFYFGVDMTGRPFYPTKKMMYVGGFNDNAFMFLREGQNRKKLTKKIISELVDYFPRVFHMDGDILSSYEIT